MMVRISKVVVVLSMGLFLGVVAVSNATDYDTNFTAVQHVLSMDTTFPDTQHRWRAIESVALHHTAYVAIIVIESIAALACLGGGVLMGRRLGDAAAFQRGKNIATFGLTLGFVLWFVGFLTLGGEWFVMWQSEDWNVQTTAFHLAAITLLMIVFVNMREDS